MKIFTLEQGNKTTKVLLSMLKLVIIILFWVVVWQLISMAVNTVILVPSPLIVAKTLLALGKTTTFWKSVFYSFLRIIVGFLTGIVGGVIFAILTTRFKIADMLFSPLLRAIRAVPVASFIILALVWIISGWLPSFIAFLIVLPVMWDNVVQGISQIDKQLLEMADVFKLSKVKTLFKVKVPCVMPYFISASTTAMGLAWKSGIAAEVISRPDFSIGKALQDAKKYLETPEVFAWTIAVATLSIVLEKILVVSTKKLSRRFSQ